MDEYLNEMFDALYGKIKDEDEELYSIGYKYECYNICNTLDDMIRDLMNYFSIDENDISKLIVLSEQRHIGNTLNIDYNKLEDLAKNILHDILC